MAKTVTIAVGIVLTAAAARAGEPGGTPDALFFSEAAAGGAVGVAFFVGGYAVGGDPTENDGTGREKGSYAVYGAAPLAAALAVYVVGETSGHRSANRGALFLATAGTFYGLAGAAAGVAYALTEDHKDAGALTAAFYTAIPAAFAAAAVYNAVKEPYFYEIPGFSLKLEPAFAVCRTGPRRNEITTAWGLSVSF